MKKILLKFEIYYNGNLSSKNGIGELILEVVLDEDRIKKGLQFIEFENDIGFDDGGYKLPINYTTIYVQSVKVVKESNIDIESESFSYKLSGDFVELTTRGEEVILKMGYPIPIDNYSL